jgi:hypothetical protein
MERFVKQARMMQGQVDDVAAWLQEQHDVTPELAAEVVRQTERDPVTGRAIQLVPFEQINNMPVEWLWTGRLALGQLNVLYGTEGLGKSSLTVALAAQASRGGLPGASEGKPAGVAFVTTEDDPETTIRPRLEAAGADLALVRFVKVSRHGYEDALSLPEDTERLARALEAADVRLVVMDPITAVLGPKVKNAYDGWQVREAVTPLVRAAQRGGFAVLGVLHTNRENTVSSRNRAGGSIAWRQIARTAAVLGIDPDNRDGDTRVIVFDKNNLGPKARSLRMTLVPKAVRVAGTTQQVITAELGEEVDFRAEDLHAAEAGSQNAGQSQLDRAMGMLYDLLGDGPKATSLIRQEAERMGLGWRTVEEAKKVIGVQAEQRGGQWFWSLPGSGLDV